VFDRVQKFAAQAIIDFIPRIEATDQQTGAISQETREAIAEENEVEVKLMSSEVTGWISMDVGHIHIHGS
jgi:ribosomal silencing factor RsfS